MRYLKLLCVVLLAGRPSARAWAQVARPLDAPAIERFTQRIGKLGGPQGALRAPALKVTAAERRAIADTLVVIAISADPRAPSLMQASDVIAVFLMTAVSSEPANRDLAIAKLRELADNPSNQIVSSVAVGALSQLNDRALAIRHLREIAISHSFGAFSAVEGLARFLGEEGRVVLKEIVLQNLLVQPQAKKDAEGYARLYKWRERRSSI